MPIEDDAALAARLTAGEITAITVDTSIFDQKQLALTSGTLQALSALKVSIGVQPGPPIGVEEGPSRRDGIH